MKQTAIDEVRMDSVMSVQNLTADGLQDVAFPHLMLKIHGLQGLLPVMVYVLHSVCTNKHMLKGHPRCVHTHSSSPAVDLFRHAANANPPPRRGCPLVLQAGSCRSSSPSSCLTYWLTGRVSHGGGRRKPPACSP